MLSSVQLIPTDSQKSVINDDTTFGRQAGIKIKNGYEDELHNHLNCSGEYRSRTDDPLLAKQVLQPAELIPLISKKRKSKNVFKFITFYFSVVPGRFELPTSTLSVQRSNQLSYGTICQKDTQSYFGSAKINFFVESKKGFICNTAGYLFRFCSSAFYG